jgi:sugar transferase (PEP-CTERM system associated)
VSNRHYSPRSVTIVTTELMWIFVTLGAAIYLDLVRRHSGLPMDQFVQQLSLAALLYVGGFYYCDLYNFSELRLRREFVSALVRAFSALALVFGVLFSFTHWLEFQSSTLLVHLLLTAAFVVVLRSQIDGLLNRYGVLTRIAIVGTGSEARGLAEEIVRRHEHGHEVACFVSDHAERQTIQVGSANPGVRRFPVIPAAALLETAQRQRIKRILVATADLAGALPVEELLRCKAEGYQVEDGHTFYERLLGRIFTAQLRPEWLIFSDGFMRSPGVRAVKRALDLITAGCLLVVTAPLCALVVLAIKLDDGGPVLFGQARVGLQGSLFTLWKFRSMQVDAEAETGPKWAEADDPRVTRVGRWIRTLRIDEIPQAWNVLRGDMSFVGPRPERIEFVTVLRSVVPYYEHRHAVRPGITGWAQVNFPYGATIDDARDKLDFDLYYLKSFSVVMDLLILFRTVKIILFGWGSR